jgi:hypothetical protein
MLKAMTALAADIFTALAAVAALFQTALIIGAPWGELTWGGRYPGKLPARGRAIAFASAVLLCGFVWVVRSRAAGGSGWLHIAAWIVVVYCVVGVITHLITPSRKERMLWLPVLLVMLATSLYVAL